MATKQNGDTTIAEAAKHLGVTQETVRRYIREGKLKATKKKTIGLRKVWMVTRDELNRFSGL
jgi:excisionase family DNA binding protein